eukprot:2207495-Rhodomonas_salina.1
MDSIFEHADHSQIQTFITTLPGLFFPVTENDKDGSHLYDITEVKKLYTRESQRRPSTSTWDSSATTPSTSAPATFASRPEHNAAT